MTGPNGTLTVVVPTKDRAGYLREALASVRAVDGPDLAIELIVVDNGSTDATPDVVAEFGGVLMHNGRAGPSATRNVGLRAASGEFVTFLDDDDVWLPGHVRPHLRMLRERPELGAVIGQVQLAGPTLEPIGGPYPATMPQDGEFFREFFRRTPQIGATVARTSVRDTVGELDEALISAEDWDWHLRLSLAHKLGFVAVPCVAFRQRPSGTHDDLQYARMAISWRVLFRNLRRAGRRGPPPFSAARTLLRYRGGYYWYFVTSARRHGEWGDRRGARRSLWRAFRASPLHLAYDGLRLHGNLYPAIGAAFCSVGSTGPGRTS